MYFVPMSFQISLDNITVTLVLALPAVVSTQCVSRNKSSQVPGWIVAKYGLLVLPKSVWDSNPQPFDLESSE